MKWHLRKTAISAFFVVGPLANQLLRVLGTAQQLTSLFATFSCPLWA